MKRRTLGLIATLGLALLVVPLAVNAQRAVKVPRLGMLLPASAPSTPDWKQRNPFLQALRELGYVEGQTIEFEWRWAERRFERLPDLASELVHLHVDVIFATSQPAIRAAQRATATIPIVMIDVGDPVQSGFIESLARPGGNITGVTAIALELPGKQLALLKEAVPEVTRMAVLGTPAPLARHWPDLQRVAQGMGVQLDALLVQDSDEFARAFERATQEGAGALIVLPVILFATNQSRLAELAAQSRLPAIFWASEFAKVGGLMAYGASPPDLARHAAVYVDKILKGAKPADLPVEQPTTFELVINLKTAKALGLTIPPTLLFQATEVIR
jgi:putative tryptophan/tyrosine transport system substrate-binding protein